MTTVNRAKIAIIGAGPIGIELAVTLKRLDIPYLHFEAKQIGHTFTWWPRNTSFFSTTERIEIAEIPIQKVTQERTTGEEYLAYLRAIIEQYDLDVHTYEPVINIQGNQGAFELRTATQTGGNIYQTENIVFANGDMDFPNRLSIPGEDLPNVSHYFVDPHPYFRKRLLIVGGKNSAVEAALRCWRAGSYVTISYRRAEFDRAAIKHWILPDLETQIRLGTIGFLPETRPVAIQPGSVTLEKQTGDRFEIPADFVLLNTGFRADSRLLAAAGVQLTGADAVPKYNPETMETNVQGIFLAGTVAAGSQSRYSLFIENTHIHVGKIVQALTGQWPEKLGTVAARKYDVPLEEIQAD